jgi:hypothetical protein
MLLVALAVRLNHQAHLDRLYRMLVVVMAELILVVLAVVLAQAAQDMVVEVVAETAQTVHQILGLPEVLAL